MRSNTTQSPVLSGGLEQLPPPVAAATIEGMRRSRAWLPPRLLGHTARSAVILVLAPHGPPARRSHQETIPLGHPRSPSARPAQGHGLDYADATPERLRASRSLGEGIGATA